MMILIFHERFHVQISSQHHGWRFLIWIYSDSLRKTNSNSQRPLRNKPKELSQPQHPPTQVSGSVGRSLANISHTLFYFVCQISTIRHKLTSQICIFMSSKCQMGNDGVQLDLSHFKNRRGIFDWKKSHELSGLWINAGGGL